MAVEPPSLSNRWIAHGMPHRLSVLCHLWNHCQDRPELVSELSACPWSGSPLFNSHFVEKPLSFATSIRLCSTSALRMGLQWHNYLQVCQNKRNESQVWPILPGNPRECTWPATTIMLKGRVDAMASTGRKPYILQRQTATWNRTRLQTYCWPVYAIRALVLLLVTNTN